MTFNSPTPMEIAIMKFTISTALLMMVTAFITNGCMSKINDRLGLSSDNFAEERIEDMIEEHTGLDIDLTPESSE